MVTDVAGKLGDVVFRLATSIPMCELGCHIAVDISLWLTDVSSDVRLRFLGVVHVIVDIAAWCVDVDTDSGGTRDIGFDVGSVLGDVVVDFCHWVLSQPTSGSVPPTSLATCTAVWTLFVTSLTV